MSEPEKRYAPECYACPIGTASMNLQRSAPEATEHLLKAGRELVAMARSVLEGMDAFLEMMEERAATAGDPKEATPDDSGVVRSIPVRREGSQTS